MFQRYYLISPTPGFKKWPDKSTTSYAMLDFERDLENLEGKYLVIERQILQIQDILLQCLKFN